MRKNNGMLSIGKMKPESSIEGNVDRQFKGLIPTTPKATA
jgi:hypothetical protein